MIAKIADRQSPIFFNLDIYLALSWGARASRAHYIVTSIESISLKAIVVNLGGFYGVYGKRVCQTVYVNILFVLILSIIVIITQLFQPRRKHITQLRKPP